MPRTGSDTARPVATAADQALRDRTLRALDAMLGGVDASMAVRLWDGTLWRPDSERFEPAFTIVLTHPGSLRKLAAADDEVSLAETYLFGDVDLEGSIESLFAAFEHFDDGFSAMRKAKAAAHLMRLPKDGEPPATVDGERSAAEVRGRRHTKHRDADAVRYHYDVPPGFFRLFLDGAMQYSCAYFPEGAGEHPDADPMRPLDHAQERKLDHLCRKLRLRPGERLLDIGCGWGGLVAHAAERYGVEVVGVTLSEPQAGVGRATIAERGLDGRADVRVLDYRDASELGTFDKAVSVGMAEHVGSEKLPEYFATVHDLLRPGGVFMNHAIGCADDGRRHPTPDGFSERYVFPDGELTTIAVTLEAAERAGFEVRDVENLREHYARTLRHWVRRLEAHRERAVGLTDEVTYRVWRLYMSGSAHGFAKGEFRLYQTLLVKPDERGRSALPLTREDWYA